MMKSLIQRFVTFIGGLVLVLFLIAILSFGSFPWNNASASFADIDEHFRYGSIGGESTNGLPYWIWKVLPDMFPEKLPGKGYQSLGFMQEDGHELPIGFAKGKVSGVPVVTQNCATCHVGQIRPDRDHPPQLISTMPSHTVDLGGYIHFLREVALDSRFNAQEIMPYIEASGARFNPLEKLLYKLVVIPRTKDALMIQGDRLSFMERQLPYGPGRVDTFTAYKTLRFNFPKDQLSASLGTTPAGRDATPLGREQRLHRRTE
jgi:hypothetical protein